MKSILPFRRRPPAPTSAEALLLPHLDTLHRIAWRWTGNAHDAEDLVQTLLAKLLQQPQTLVEVAELRPWLARALYNQFVDQTRRSAVAPTQLTETGADQDALAQLIDEDGESPEAFAERCLSHERLSAALLQLNPEQRALVVWHDVEGYTLEEIADSRSIALGTLKSRLHRARARLRELLMEPFSGAVRDKP